MWKDSDHHGWQHSLGKRLLIVYRCGNTGLSSNRQASKPSTHSVPCSWLWILTALSFYHSGFPAMAYNQHPTPKLIFIRIFHHSNRSETNTIIFNKSPFFLIFELNLYSSNWSKRIAISCVWQLHRGEFQTLF